MTGFRRRTLVSSRDVRAKRPAGSGRGLHRRHS